MHHTIMFPKDGGAMLTQCNDDVLTAPVVLTRQQQLNGEHFACPCCHQVVMV